MGPHDDQLRIDRRRGPQNPIEWITRNYHGTASDRLKFRHRADLFSKNSFGLALFQFDQFLWLIVIYDMDNSELRVLKSGE
jgi:hypothetical protein